MEHVYAEFIVCRYRTTQSVNSLALIPLRTVVPYMRRGKMKFDTCEEIAVTCHP